MTSSLGKLWSTVPGGASKVFATGLALTNKLEHAESLIPFILPVIEEYYRHDPNRIIELIGEQPLALIRSKLLNNPYHPKIQPPSEVDTKMILNCVNGDKVLEKECPFNLETRKLESILKKITK